MAGVAAGTLISMDTQVIEQSGIGTAAGGVRAEGTEGGTEDPETTIDEVDQLLDEVEAALTRLDEGTYGACSSCGTVIEDARLSADPTARTCAACDADASEYGHADADAATDSTVYGVDRAADLETADRADADDGPVYGVDCVADVETEDRAGDADEPVYAVDRAADLETEDRADADEPVYAVDRAAEGETEDRADDEDDDDVVDASGDGQDVTDADPTPWSFGRPPEG